jgi:hypothetical protein
MECAAVTKFGGARVAAQLIISGHAARGAVSTIQIDEIERAAMVEFAICRMFGKLVCIAMIVVNFADEALRVAS